MPYEEEDEEMLLAHEVKRYQSLTARANYLAQDRSDIQFSVNELARSMSAPISGSWQGSLKFGKYFKTIAVVATDAHTKTTPES